MTSFWLVKTEPNVYSINDLARDRNTAWHGVRNYQARNYLKSMKVGDMVLFYHSSNEPIGVAGLANIDKAAFPDPTQFDKKGEYFDAKATTDQPRWFCPSLKFVKEFSQIIPLADLRKDKGLKDMQLLKKGSRLSVQPVQEAEYKIILKLAGVKD